ncbi:secA [Acrasis kona]|uniref:SecA n=1 Tax=Acrasis kona TaxID=1008807 RepID=A0AAW2Z7D4_9EUKA
MIKREKSSYVVTYLFEEHFNFQPCHTKESMMRMAVVCVTFLLFTLSLAFDVYIDQKQWSSYCSVNRYSNSEPGYTECELFPPLRQQGHNINGNIITAKKKTSRGSCLKLHSIMLMDVEVPVYKPRVTYNLRNLDKRRYFQGLSLEARKMTNNTQMIAFKRYFYDLEYFKPYLKRYEALFGIDGTGSCTSEQTNVIGKLMNAVKPKTTQPQSPKQPVKSPAVVSLKSPEEEHERHLLEKIKAEIASVKHFSSKVNEVKKKLEDTINERDSHSRILNQYQTELNVIQEKKANAPAPEATSERMQ